MTKTKKLALTNIILWVFAFIVSIALFIIALKTIHNLTVQQYESAKSDSEPNYDVISSTLRMLAPLISLQIIAVILGIPTLVIHIILLIKFKNNTVIMILLIVGFFVGATALAAFIMILCQKEQQSQNDAQNITLNNQTI
ncbi:hypothetical protein [Mycoplasmopsis felifaucium]|uniref:hypothetical protein n=1 Tax=Mycoplasmopsis felifaucium TaxID=35768 RepID=UPI0004827B3E|nr:hypothetical protein [Mycoplasmopsis felifaucium]